MKIYTKTGDDGTTALISKRVKKDDLRIECYGLIDELLGYIGVSHNKNITYKNKNNLEKIMRELYMINSFLANPNKQQILDNELITCLEYQIDEMSNTLPELKGFIKPVGSEEYTFLNLCRTKVRTVERRLVTLSAIEDVDVNILKYFNRLSDYFFVLSRYENKNSELYFK